MSIPRLAIHRPVTMFMLSGVIVLLGAISLTRLPVDLMPEFALPTIAVSVNYTGVGPLEMEQLVTRPLEQAAAAVPGVQQVNSSSSEGRSQVRLNFAWGTDMSEALDEVRSRIDRVRGRLPEDADPPQIFKADPNAFPIINLAVDGDFDPVTLREIAENELAPRLERAPGVAAVTTASPTTARRAPASSPSSTRASTCAACSTTRASTASSPACWGRSTSTWAATATTTWATPAGIPTAAGRGRSSTTRSPSTWTR